MAKTRFSNNSLSLVFEFASISALIPVIQVRLVDFEGDKQMQLMAFAGFTLVALFFSSIISRICDRFGTNDCARYLAIVSLATSVLACFSINSYEFLIAIALKGAAVSREVVSLLESAHGDDSTIAKRGVAEIAIAKALGYTFGPIITILGYTFFGTNTSSQPFALPLSIVLSLISLIVLLMPEKSRSAYDKSINRRSFAEQSFKSKNSPFMNLEVFAIAFVAGIASGALYSYLPFVSLHKYGLAEPSLSGAFATMGIVLVITIVVARSLGSKIQDVSWIGKLSAIASICGLVFILESDNYTYLLISASLSYASVILITLSLSMKLAVKTSSNQSTNGFGARSAGYLAGQGGGAIIAAGILPNIGAAVLFTIVGLFLAIVWPLFSRISLPTED